eukprot:10746066-Karenia_brevis.AAC.1
MDMPPELATQLHTLTQQLHNHQQVLSQLTHNTHNLYNITDHQQTHLLHNTQANINMMHQLESTQQHMFSTSISISHNKARNYTQFQEIITQNQGTHPTFSTIIHNTKPQYHYYKDKNLHLFYQDPSNAITQLKKLQQDLPTPPFNITKTVTPLLQQ